MWLKIFLIILTILFVIILVIKRFVYFRPTYEFIQPQDTYTDVYEGNLHAWYKHGITGKVILFCHGNGGNLSHRQDKIMALSKMGHSVLIFDYSGFGRSRGVPNEQMCYANADMFVNYLLRSGYSKQNIIPYGESLGAAIAAHVARKYNLPAVIIESGLPGIKYLIKYWYPFLSILNIFFDEFNTIQYLTGYHGKIFMMHSIQDEVIPYPVTEGIRKLATISIDINGSHNSPVIPWDNINEFLKSV